MIRNVVFDIGNVLVDWFWKRNTDRLFTPEVSEAVTDAAFSCGDWNEFDRGVLSYEEIVGRMISHRPEYADQIRKAVEESKHALELFDYAIPWVQELKGLGYQVYYLSNYSLRLRKARPDVLKFTEYMDGGVFSYEIKHTKPDPVIYRVLLDTYQLKPEECLFIDDRQDNLDGAAAFGIHTYRFDGYEPGYREIMKILEENR